MPVNIERWVMVDNHKIKEKETLYIEIPKGIDDDEIIVVKQKGNIINDNNIGDVKIFVHILNTTIFKREGMNLFYIHSITLKEALCGFKFNIDDIKGECLKFENSNSNIITPNKTIKIKNKGMERLNHKGDLIIQFNIIFPKTISYDNINLLKQIL
jgi:DnaJ-class molecular chaperone